VKLGTLHLTQRDGVTCGPAVAVVAGALLDPGYRARLTGHAGRGVGAAGRAWFDGEQGRVHDAVNRVWPQRFGTTPMGVARAISVHSARYGVRYRWRSCRGLVGRRDGLEDVLAAVDAHWPVGMLVGNHVPRHWVLVVERAPDAVRCYEPSSGEVRVVELEAIRDAKLTNVGFPRPFAFVLPKAPYSNI
jgi:hypothetical protein